MYWKKHNIYRVLYYLQFEASTGGLETYPPIDVKGLLNFLVIVPSD